MKKCVQIDEKLHRILKTASAEAGLQLQDVINQLLVEGLKSLPFKDEK